MHAIRLVTFAVLACLMMAANCVGPVEPPGGNSPCEAALRAFESPEEMRTFLASQATVRNGNGGGELSWLPSFEAAPAGEDLAGAPNAGDAEGSGNLNFSTTNIQEEGVDESDLIKNDGEYIYMLSGDKVHVIRATPPQGMAEVAVIQVDAYGTSMYLRGNTLVVLSSRYQYGYGWTEPAVDGTGADAVNAQMVDVAAPPWGGGHQSTIAILDVSDPANPRSIKTIRFEGHLVSSRLIGSRLHVVLTACPKLPADPTVTAIEAMTLDEWIPDVQIVNADGAVSSGNVVGWQGALRPADPNGYSMTIVATLDVDEPDIPLSTTAVTANTGTIYASTQALYLTDTQYSWTHNSSRTDTIIHKLAFTDAGTDYVASGLVPGRPLNQYSMGEYDDYLRVATTNEQFSENQSDVSSGVYVLGVDGPELTTVGSVEGIAPGETIYAARFVGTRGFLVTFRRIDPLFTMDLSDPADPRIVGELKVPGYSDHIQMLGENHLLTIGRNTQEVGDFAWVQGVLLTIFDVSDMANPQILTIGDTEARVEIGGRGTYSEANSDPKAFNYFAAKNALAFPVDLYEGQTIGAEYGQHAFTGLYVFRVTVENGFEFLGRIASAGGLAGNGCFRGYYGTTRGVFIEDFVYAVTTEGAKAAPLEDVDSVVGEVMFTGAQEPPLECFWVDPELMLPPSEDLR